MNNHDDFIEMDFEWYAIDSIKQIGFFTTAGARYFPAIFENLPQFRNSAWQYFNKMPKTTESIVCKKHGIIEDWIAAAESGFYGYDYDIHGNNKSHILVCKPKIPLIFSVDIQNIRLPFYKGVFGVSEINKDEVRNWILV
jgi:hypothetical protein